MSIGPKGVVRAAAMVLVGITVGGMAGCGGGGEEGGIVRPTPPATPTPPVTPVPPTPNLKYVGFANGFVDADACHGVAAISTNHDSQSAAQDAARRRCQSAGATNCRAGWARNGCGAIAAGVNDAGRCALSNGLATTVAEAGSNAQTSCQDALGLGVLCDVLVSGCAAESFSPSVVRWSPSTGGPRPPTGGPTRNLRDVTVTIPSSCPRQVEMCVRDHQCEDGDQVRVSVNGSVIFSGELSNAWDCRTVPVGPGNNVFELYAINGTGFKGPCDHSDANTGEIRVRGGSSSSTQSWEHTGGTGSSAHLNVAIGPAGGSCTPGGTTPPPQRRYGAIATYLSPDCRGPNSWGIAANFSTRSAAESAAVSACRTSGCALTDEFGNTYVGNRLCGALAYGEKITGNRTECRLRTGTGGTESAAESEALSICRSGGFACNLVRETDGSRFARCAE